MIVRIVNREENSDRHIHCLHALVCPDNEVGNDGRRFCLIVGWENGKDATWPLSEGDRIYYMNDKGETIDSDMRLTVKPGD